MQTYSTVLRICWYLNHKNWSRLNVGDTLAKYGFKGVKMKSNIVSRGTLFIIVPYIIVFTKQIKHFKVIATILCSWRKLLAQWRGGDVWLFTLWFEEVNELQTVGGGKLTVYSFYLLAYEKKQYLLSREKNNSIKQFRVLNWNICF